jgi:hypothetical protein
MAFRTHRVTAWGSLVTLVVGLAMPMLPGLHVAATAPDDCAPLVRPLTARQIDARTAPDSAPPEHCVMCHWLRTARSASMHPPLPADPVFTSRTADRPPTILVVSRLIVLEGPSRAPPAV